MLTAIRKHLWTALLLAAAALALAWSWSSQTTAWLEEPMLDRWFRYGGPRYPAGNVLLVELDEPTLADNRQDPLVFWTPQFARAVAVLRAGGARVIGLDFLFSVSPEGWINKLGSGGEVDKAARSYDQDFQIQLSKGDVILAGEQTDRDILIPSAEYVLALPDSDIEGYVGSTFLGEDRDGVSRRFRLSNPVKKGQDFNLHSFSLLMALRASGQKPESPQWKFGARGFDRGSAPLRINYAGAAGHVEHVSMRELSAPGAQAAPGWPALAARIKGRIAIIAPAFAASNDRHPTPHTTGPADTMWGAEIESNVIETLLSGRFFDSAPLPVAALFIGVPMALGFAVFRRRSLNYGLIALLLLALVILGCGYGAHRADLLLPSAHALIGLAAVFLASSAFRMTKSERDRTHMRKLFSSYVSNDVVNALLASPQLPQLGGAAVNVTVLFSDIRNFTTISEKLKPDEVVGMLNAYFERICPVILAEGGCIDKYIGDAIMVEFGAPLPQADHALRALRAALRMQEIAADFRAWMEQHFGGRGLPEFAVGIGMHSGEAVMGNIGSSARMEYTAIGDAVNLASRLESASKELGWKIVASESTMQAALRFGEVGIVFGQSATINVKGREQAVKVFEALRPSPAAG
ncbi:MAG TPA: adenylate/guanylate cyclase domain-containing protein [Burkholderiales bacterium]|nr:adenylate/guanylate cyclase domain-containing protein [Burkholderiales bacterium]